MGVIEQPVHRISQWLRARDTIQLVGLILGAILALSTIIGGIMTLGAKLAERDFVTVPLMKEREAIIIQQLERRIASGEALAAQRETALTQRIEVMATGQAEANVRMRTSIDRIYNLLLQGRR